MLSIYDRNKGFEMKQLKKLKKKSLFTPFGIFQLNKARKHYTIVYKCKKENNYLKRK